MRKITLLSLITVIFAIFALVLGTCNSGDPNVGGNGEGGATNVIYVWGELDEMSETVSVKPGTTEFDYSENSNNYPGNELNLADCDNIYTWDKESAGGSGKWEKTAVLGDISNYGEIILYAQLFDKDDNELTTGTSIAQFSILKDGSSGWDDVNKLAEKHNLVSSALTEVTGSEFKTITPAGSTAPTSSATGLPGKLLVQGSYENSAKTDESVVKVHIIALEFRVRSDLPVFTHLYGDNVSCSSNKITFNDAMYSDGAVLFDFPDTFPTFTSGQTDATGKLVFSFTITPVDNPSPSNATEYQIHIQAANGQDNFNGTNPPDWEDEKGGQQVVNLDEPNGGKYDITYKVDTMSGTFKVPFSNLVKAANGEGQGGGANDKTGTPFALTAVRICNNGDKWTGGTPSAEHIRHKSFSITFSSITFE